MFANAKYSFLLIIAFALLPPTWASAQRIANPRDNRAIKPPVQGTEKVNPKALIGEGVPLVAKDIDPKVVARLPKEFRAVRPYKVPTMTIRPGPNVPAFSVDLRPFIASNQLLIRDQGNRGTCSVFATTFSIEYAMTKAYGKGFADFSEEFLNGAGNMVSGKTDDGDFFYVLDNGYQKYGICMEIFMPYQATMAAPPNANQQKLASVWKRLIPDFIKPWDNTQGVVDAQFNKAISYLGQKLPVATGLWWPKEGHFGVSNIKGVDVMTDPGKANMFDGHSVSLVGYAKSPDFPGGGFFVFRNSWGTEFGDKGYGYFSFDYVKKYANDLFVYKEPTE